MVFLLHLRACRYRLYGVLLREEASFHDVNEPGQLTSRLTSDCYAITRCIATNVNVALRNMVQVIGEWWWGASTNCMGRERHLALLAAVP